MNRMKRMLLPLLSLLLLVVLSACAGISGQTATTPAESLARVQAAEKYLTGSLAKIETVVATAKEQAPDKAAAIEAKIEPTVGTLSKLVGAYNAAADASDVTAADSQWDVAREAVTNALAAGAEVLGPKILLGLLGV